MVGATLPLWIPAFARMTNDGRKSRNWASNWRKWPRYIFSFEVYNSARAGIEVDWRGHPGS